MAIPEANERAGRRKLAVTVAAPFLGLLGVEFAVRAAGIEPPPRPTRAGELYESGAEFGIERVHRPGGWREVGYPEADGSLRLVRMQVNEQRFRGPLAEIPKPAGRLRVVCIGDSMTFGDGVATEEAWPAQLELELQARWPDQEVEVLKCGVNAYDTDDEVRWLTSYLLPTFEPDVVLLGYFVNDTNDPGNTRVRDRWLELAAPGRPGWVGALREHSKVAALVLDGIWRQRGLSRYVDLRKGGYEEDAPGWQAVTAALLRAHRELAEREIGFAVVLLPFLWASGDGDGLASDDALALVAAFCEREGIRVFDASPLFRDADELANLRVSPHDYHMNGVGYERLAAALAEWL